MIINSFNLILSIIIATCLVILQETMSNIFWLISVDMPVSIGIFISTYVSNLFAMNLSGAVPLIALIAIGFKRCLFIFKNHLLLIPVFNLII